MDEAYLQAAQERLDSLNAAIHAIDRGILSISEAGSEILASASSLSMTIDLNDRFWTDIAEWGFAKIQPYISDQGPEFLAWRKFLKAWMEIMPDEVKNPGV